MRPSSHTPLLLFVVSVLVGGAAQASPRGRYVPQLVEPQPHAPNAAAAHGTASTAGSTFAPWEGKAHAFGVGTAHPVKILFFHGAGQPAYLGKDGVQDNDLVRRVAGALREAGVTHQVVSLPWETNRGAVESWLRSEPGPFIVAGHSTGGAFAADLVARHPEKFRASVLINPATAIGAQAVPTLLIRGTEDDSAHQDDVGHDRANVSLLRPAGADHALRVRPGHAGARTFAALNAATQTMNAEVAQAIRRFLARQLPATH